MLAAMFAERDSCSPNIPLSVDSQGAYFIDYDVRKREREIKLDYLVRHTGSTLLGILFPLFSFQGSRFGDILNFLRDDGSFLAPVDPGERQKLYQAACYFQVIGLMQVVHPCPSFTDKLVTSAQTTATVRDSFSPPVSEHIVALRLTCYLFLLLVYCCYHGRRSLFEHLPQ